MTADISIVYLTYRLDPRFEWFADSLARQIGDDHAELVLVDGVHSPERTTQFEAMARGRFSLRHVPAKPTPYAGPHRRTSRNFFSAASARNTGIIHTTAPYLAFVDDLSIVMPGWWDEVRSAAKAGSVVAGAYQKHREVVVEDGVLVSSVSDPHGRDSRWGQGNDTSTVAIGGAQLFGCSFGAPRDLLLEVNGFDELCDSIGGEDWHFGVRVDWTGAPILYSRRMLTIESEEHHHLGTAACRLDKSAPPGAYLRRLREFGVSERQFEGQWDSSHMILDILFGTRSVQTQGNYYLLSALAPDQLDQTTRRFPRSHWFDGQSLSEL
jgi:hypothetical protein